MINHNRGAFWQVSQIIAFPADRWYFLQIPQMSYNSLIIDAICQPRCRVAICNDRDVLVRSRETLLWAYIVKLSNFPQVNNFPGLIYTSGRRKKDTSDLLATRLDPGWRKLLQLSNRALLMYTENNLAVFRDIYVSKCSSWPPTKVQKYNLLRENKVLMRSNSPVYV